MRSSAGRAGCRAPIIGGQLARISPQTALAFIALGTALFLAAWERGCRADEYTPRWLPAPVALAITTSGLVLFFALDSKQDTALAATVANGAQSVIREAGRKLEVRARTLTHMARRWEKNGAPTEASWNFEAGPYVADFPDIQAVEWIDPAGHIRWIAPLKDNEEKLGLDAAREARRAAAVETSRREHHAVFSGAVTLFRGGLGVIVYMPLEGASGQFEGWIAGVFHLQSFLDRFLPPEIAAGQALRLSEGSQTIYGRAADAPRSQPMDWTAHGHIRVAGLSLDLETWPTPELQRSQLSHLPGITLAVSVANALLLAALCTLAQRHQRTAHAQEATAMRLQRALAEVKTLEGLLPLCCGCKRVRDDTGYWNQIDTYLHRHTDAKLSHSYCPECAAKAFTDEGIAIPARVQAELNARRFE